MFKEKMVVTSEFPSIARWNILRDVICQHFIGHISNS